jgi:hypothetical protein
VGEKGRDDLDPLLLREFERFWMGVGGGSDLGGRSGVTNVVRLLVSFKDISDCEFFAVDWRSLIYRCIVGKRSFLYPDYWYKSVKIMVCAIICIDGPCACSSSSRSKVYCRCSDKGNCSIASNRISVPHAM